MMYMISKYNTRNVQTITIPNIIIANMAQCAGLVGCESPWYGPSQTPNASFNDFNDCPNSVPVFLLSLSSHSDLASVPGCCDRTWLWQLGEKCRKNLKPRTSDNSISSIHIHHVCLSKRRHLWLCAMPSNLVNIGINVIGGSMAEQLKVHRLWSQIWVWFVTWLFTSLNINFSSVTSG